ncbi:hypothetical protein ES708_29368 [subsurface metagenome]
MSSIWTAPQVMLISMVSVKVSNPSEVVADASTVTVPSNSATLEVNITLALPCTGVTVWADNVPNPPTGVSAAIINVISLPSQLKIVLPLLSLRTAIIVVLLVTGSTTL